MGPIEIAAIAAGSALVVAGAVYGALRKFSRLTWIGWQILIAFGLTVATGYLPVPQNKTAAFVVNALCFTLTVAVPLALEWVCRRALVKKRILPPSTGEMVFDRIFGAITAILGALMFFLVLGAFGLAAAESFTGKTFLNFALWNGFLSKHAVDLFLASLFLVVMRAGFRLGALKGLYMLLMIVLTFGAFFACFLLASRVGFGVAFSRWVGSLFPLPAVAGALVGCVIVTFLFFAVVFVGLMFFSKFLNWAVCRANSVRAVEAVDSILVGILFTAVFLVAVCGMNLAYSALEDGSALTGLINSLPEQIAGSVDPVADMVTNAMGKMVDFVRSSPLSCALYDFNPFLAG